MSICKVQLKENGAIEGCQKIEAEDHAFWIDGVVVDEKFYTEFMSDPQRTVDTMYFDFYTEKFVLRPTVTAEPNKLSITADGIDLFILTGLPIPCTVTVDSAEYQVNDGEFGFPTVLKGTYTVKVSQFPYIDKEWEVIAV